MKIGGWAFLIFFFSSLLGSQEATDQADKLGAKEIFWDLQRKHEEELVIPEPPKVGREKHPRREIRSAPSGVLSLRYWIELRGPSPSENGSVTESRTFKSGERIRLHFSSSTGGYISLAQRNKNGSLTFLFPSPEKGLFDTRIKPSVNRILPSENVWLKFDDKPSTERILILFADSPKSLTTLVQSATTSEAPIEGQLGSKDLVLDVEESEPSQIGTYLVSRDGRAVIRDIFLKHQG
jgi:hypothetical protein